MELRKRDLLLLTLLAALLFFTCTWAYDLWPPDEPRFAQVAREMMEKGNYLSPYCNAEPYKEKPPLLFWTISVLSQPFGDATNFSSRAASGLAALVTVLVTYLLATRLYGRQTGLWAALILMTTGLFLWEARSVRTDMLLTACMTGAFYAFSRWHESRRPGWLVLLYACLCAGLFTKGPPALMFVLLLIFAFYWKEPTERRQTHWVVGAAIALVLLLAWMIPARMALPHEASEASRSGGNIFEEAFHQIIGRAVLGVSKAQWPWYYLTDAPLGLFPWTLFLPWTLIWAWRHRREDGRMRLLLSWIIPAFIAFSIIIGKRNVYLLPLYPALAIVTARAVLDLAAGDHAVWRRRTAWVWTGLMFGVACVPVAMRFSEFRQAWTPAMLILSVLGVAFALGTLRSARNGASNLHALMTGHFAAIAVAAFIVVLPGINVLKGAGDMCRPLREMSLAGTEYRLYSVGFSREEYIYYSRHPHKDVLNELLAIETDKKMGEMAMAKQQIALKKAISKAVDKVAVANPGAPTAEETKTLLDAVTKAVEQAKVDPELAKKFEQALLEAVHQFAAEFEGAGPAYVFVQEDDWKWLVPFCPRLGAFSLVTKEAVGRRDMLLLANPDGVKLLGAK